MTVSRDGWAASHVRATAKWLGAAVVCAAVAGPVAFATLENTTAPGNGAAGKVPLPVAPLVTVQDLMRDEVDANSDPIWDAVGAVTTRSGIAERQPRTEAEWQAVRQHAVVLLEATNLLVIPGRKVSAVPFPSAGPGVLSSQDIQQRIDQHRAQFNAHALALRAIALGELQAIDRHDAKTLQSLGEGMDAACESCHTDNWYPHEVIPELPATPPPPPPR